MLDSIEATKKILTRREFLKWLLGTIAALVAGFVGASFAGPMLQQLKGKPNPTPAIIDYSDLSVKWWNWYYTGVQSAVGITFLGGSPGFKNYAAREDKTITTPAGHKLFFSPLRYIGPPNLNDVGSNGVTYSVDGGDIQVNALGRITSRPFAFNDWELGRIEGISDGYWYMSEPLQPGKYTLQMNGKIPQSSYEATETYTIVIVE